MRFDTKLALVIREDLPVWQKLNMTAFLASGVAAGATEVIGAPYEDGSGNVYLPMFRQPVLVFGASPAQLRTVYERAMARGVRIAIFTDALFTTGNDDDNRAAVRAVLSDDLALAGIALHSERKVVDRIVKGLTLHP